MDVDDDRDSPLAWQSGSVLVFGASSQIGWCLLPMLGGAGARVSALSRRGQPPRAGVRWLQGALPEPPAAAGEADSICCFAPIEELARWVEAGAAPSLRRVVATSSMSAQSKRGSPVASERAVSQRLRDGEGALMRACERRGIDCTILRPTMIYGAARDRNLTPLARRAVRWRVFALPAGAGLRQPVHAADVAGAVLRALDGAAAGRVLEIGGGERLAAGEMFARVRASLRGPLSRLDRDLVADNAELERLLGVHPRGFDPDWACWGL
jgi:uncharacterized protein YbjT (DUF2867 family)